jgi:hypothetical protein
MFTDSFVASGSGYDYRPSESRGQHTSKYRRSTRISQLINETYLNIAGNLVLRRVYRSCMVDMGISSRV